MKTKILALLCILFILGACRSPEEPEVQKKITLHIQGIVTDETNGSPISDASIHLYESSLLGFESYFRVSVKTNQEGRYTLNYFIGYSDNILFGYYLEAQKDGYLNSKWIQVQYTSNTQLIDFQLEPLGFYMCDIPELISPAIDKLVYSPSYNHEEYGSYVADRLILTLLQMNELGLLK